MFFTIVLFFCEFILKADGSLLRTYLDAHQRSLNRLVLLENKIDGMNEEFRKLLNDRKRSYDVHFKEKGKLLDMPLLTNAIITERKRLEKEEAFLEELKKSPFLIKQMEKKMAAQLVALDLTNILATFVEFLDEFNRGIKPMSGPKDPEVVKVSAGTLTALAYSKSKKESLALADPAIYRLIDTEARKTLSLIESGLGKLSEDSMGFAPEGLSKSEREKFELNRLVKTKKLIAMIDQIATIMTVTNKDLSDEYQYHVFVLNQKLKENRELSGGTIPK